jgi:hypothetical protein
MRGRDRERIIYKQWWESDCEISPTCLSLCLVNSVYALFYAKLVIKELSSRSRHSDSACHLPQVTLRLKAAFRKECPVSSHWLHSLLLYQIFLFISCRKSLKEIKSVGNIRNMLSRYSYLNLYLLAGLHSTSLRHDTNLNTTFYYIYLKYLKDYYWKAFI